MNIMQLIYLFHVDAHELFPGFTVSNNMNFNTYRDI